MTTEAHVGDAYIDVDARTNEFRQAMEKLRGTAKRLGGQLADDIGDPLKKRLKKTMAEVKSTFSRHLREMRTDVKFFASEVNKRMRQVARNIRDVISGALAPFQAAAIHAFTRARDSAKEFASSIRNTISGALSPFRAAATNAFAQARDAVSKFARTVRTDAGIVRTLLSDLGTRAVNEVRFKFATAFDDARFRVRTATRAISRALSSMRTAIGYNVDSAKRALNNFLSNTTVGRLVSTAGRLGRDMGSAIGAGFRLTIAKARVTALKSMQAMQSSWERVTDRVAQSAFNMALRSSVAFTRVSSAARSFAAKTIGPMLSVLPSFKRVEGAASGVGRAIRAVALTAKTAGKAFQNTMKRIANKVSTAWLRMDSTVRLVIISILIAAQPLAAVFSGISAALVGLVSSIAGVVAGFAAMAGVLAPLALGIAAAVQGLKDLESFAPGAAAALESLKQQFSGVAVPALMQEWGSSLEGFFTSLRGFITEDLFSSLGASLASATEGLTAVLDGEVGQKFAAALQGPLAGAFDSLVGAIAPLSSALLSFLAATAPYAQELLGMFRGWAEALAESFSGLSGSAEFHQFMAAAVDATRGLFVVLGLVKDVLFNVFEAGIGPGNIFLGMLTNILTEFNNFLESADGQDALRGFFDNLIQVMPPLFNLIGAVGTALANLVTPEVLEDIGGFLDALSEIMPVVGQLLAVLGQAHVVQLLSAAIQAFGAVLTPLAGPLTTFITLLSDNLMAAFTALMPAFETIGTALGTFFTALSPLIPIVADLVVLLVSGLADILIGLAPLIAEIIEAMVPLAEQFLEVATTALPPLIEMILGLAESVGPLLMPLIEALIPILELQMLAFAAITPVLKILTPLIKLLATLVGAAITVVGKILKPLADMMGGADGVSRALDRFTGWIDTAIGWIENITDAISDWASNLDLGRWFSDLWDDISSWFDDVVGWFQGLPGDISSAFSGLANTISSPFKNAFNSVARAWNNSVGKLSWTAPSWIPGFGGKSISAPKLPTFAAGAMLNGATLNIAGEAGPEAIVPLERTLTRVDPAVRPLSALLQGKASMGGTSKSISIENGAIQVHAPGTDPYLAASSVLDRIAARVVI